MLQVSKTPLYMRIDCPKMFPTQKPNIVILARVVHKDLHPKTKTCINSQLDNWDLYNNSSNLLSVIRDIHGRFNANPPIPEKMA
jgi:ubiquitin-protein ligase